MKYLVSLLLGVVAGMSVLAAALYFNPFAAPARVSPLAVSESSIMGLSFSVVPSESLILTNDGDSMDNTHPDRVQELWEPAVRKSQAMVTLLTDRLGEPIGIGVKISSISEDTRITNSEFLVDSVWHVYLPGRGSFFVDQVENRWSYYHEIVIPAWWSSSDSWRGNWRNVMTVGPNALGTARVTGANGAFAGLQTEAVEALAAKAFSIDSGPVAITGNLTISLPGARDSDETL
ncbi:MAG: hypothetical protein KJO31_18895 [Gammaproteobacteria bacterium]|nr:hypothetical protein [Gammaproteobacteria bacterium]